jgi:choline dehydrogenase
VNRRDLLKAALALAGAVSARARLGASRAAATISRKRTSPDDSIQAFEPEYIVVGSGAGGGTVAARLAEYGYRVLVLEAGTDPRAGYGDTPAADGARLPDDYDVPAFHAFATEHESMRWDFWVRHYADDKKQQQDPKYRASFQGQPVNGVWYPRAGTLGGCTAHNAMILVYPHQTDWNEIADITGDASWKPEKMRAYFERLEECRHRPIERLWTKLGRNPSRHGWKGWLPTELAIPDGAFRDGNLRTTIRRAANRALDIVGHATGDDDRRESHGDPNDWRVARHGAVGVRFTPLTTRDHKRVGTRERLLDVQQRYPDRLRIELNALATRVIFDASMRAVGVEYLKGARLYRAHASPSSSGGERRELRASREVILAGGTFNTPQLLMLSGVGPAAELSRLKIPVRLDLPGVGARLQDRYEVSVVNRMKFDAWETLRGTTFTNRDDKYRLWKEKRDGVYVTNGAMLSVIASSRPGRPVPDLFCYGLLAKFNGYEPGYSKVLPGNPNYLTWVVLKGHTANTAGSVTLRSIDPRDPPEINFRYFEEGDDAGGDDLRAVVEGIKLARKFSEPIAHLIEEEESPGPARATDPQLEQFVRDRAWGHHASSTCRIGPRASGGVLDGNFSVHGTTGLRIVDASIFPRTPGLFIVSAIYMAGEKAADVIAADARRGGKS